MPYSPEHKQRTRARIVEAARRLFNRHGFELVSIEQVMSEAGLTRGGFYNHFASKEDLYGEAMIQFAERQDARMREQSAEHPHCPSGVVAARMVLDAYLSRRHLEDLDNHCPLIALPSDVARANPVVRSVYEKLLRGLVGMLENELGVADEARRQAALAMASLCVGGMVLARTVEDDALRDELLSAAHSAALAVGSIDPDPAAGEKAA